jgi:hypothetical protein
MRFGANRRWVVWRYKHSKRLAGTGKRIPNRGDDLGVDVFHGLNLVFDAALVSGLVCRFQMNADDVVSFEGFDCRGGFAGEVGVDKPGGAGNDYVVKPVPVVPEVEEIEEVE